MLRSRPGGTNFIIFVYPPAKIQLGRRGWRLHGSAFASIPAIGVSLESDALTFWEAGADGPTLTLPASQIESARVGRVSDGYRDHPAIELKLYTTDRSDRLQLNLRDARHRNLSHAALNEALGRILAMSGTAGSNVTAG